MPKEIKDTTYDIMNKIRKGGYKMRPRSYFILASVLATAGVAVSAVISVFSVSLTRFALRGYGSLVKPQVETLAFDFPWWALVIALASLLLGLVLIRRYEFYYRNKFWLVSTVLAVSTFAIGWGVDAAKLDEVVINHTPVQNIMKQYQRQYENGVKAREQFRQEQKEQGQLQKGSQEVQQVDNKDNGFQNQFQEQNQVQNKNTGPENGANNSQSEQENSQASQGSQNGSSQGSTQESGNLDSQKKGR